jgi:hypothetical protein
MDMSYTRVLHIKVAYRVPHKWSHAFYRPTFLLAVPNFVVRVSGVFAYVVTSGDKSWNYQEHALDAACHIRNGFLSGIYLWLNGNILHNEPKCRALILTCDKYMSSLRHIHDPVLSSLKMKGICFFCIGGLVRVMWNTKMVQNILVLQNFLQIFFIFTLQQTFLTRYKDNWKR